MEYMIREAALSDCGQYRYTLDRKWKEGQGVMFFVMLNPSTADHREDDPTIRRCVGFAEREGYGAMTVLNLFAYRTPYPDQLRKQADPAGPDNPAFLMGALSIASMINAPIVCAWGNNRLATVRGQRFAILAEAAKVQLKCLGTTNGGSPRHPLYLPKDAPLKDWSL